jgi:signal transduction histidine kinase/ligand-binding sensor domain-containing protein
MWFCARDGISRFDGYRFVNYRIGTGSAYPNFMLETRNGVYWIALNGGGLYRYDPSSVRPNGAATQAEPGTDDGRIALDAEVISEQNLSSLYEDRNGNLWAAGSDGLSLIQDGSGQILLKRIELNLPDELKRQFFGVYAIAEDHDGSLWLGTSLGLMRRLPDGCVVRYRIRGQGDIDFVRTLLVDRDGRIWIGDNAGGALGNAGLCVMKPEPDHIVRATGAFTSRVLKARQQSAPDGVLPLPEAAGEVVDYSGVEALHPATGRKPSPSPASQGIFWILQTSDGRVWLSCAYVLAAFDGQRFQAYTAAHGLPDTFLATLAEDNDGDLWVATGIGPLRLSPRGLTSYGKADGFADPYIASIYEDNHGTLQVVNGRYFISSANGGGFATVRPNLPEAPTGWTSNVALLDHADQWWFITETGLYHFARLNRPEDLGRHRPLALYTQHDGLKSTPLYCAFEDSGGDLWISTRAVVTGLTRWQRSTRAFHTFTEAEGFPPGKSPASFAEDRAGNLWFGFYQGGLARYAAGRFTAFTPEQGLPEGFITGLHVDGAGRLWITSSVGGLARVDDPAADSPHFVSYTTREGLSSNNVRCVTEDLAGRIYLGTVRGVDRLTPDTGAVTHFSVSDGLAGDFVNCAYRDRRGALWFGTLNGLSRLNPQPDRAPSPQSISINGLRIGGIKQPISQFGTDRIAGLSLGPAQNDLQIDFSSLSIGHAALLRYQYQLEGADSDWSAPTDQRTVNYANLAPGSYRFVVRALTADGRVSPSPATITFTILPPLWRQWWFIALAAAVLGLMGYSLYRYRLAQLIELERVRTRIATDLHDDIGSALSQIAILSEVARKQLGTPDAAASTPLGRIAHLSRESVDAMSDIVWAINPLRDRMSDLTHRMRYFANEVLSGRTVEFRFHAGDEQHHKLAAETRREVFLIFKESINNIVRHSGCTEADIEFSCERGRLVLAVHDNGCGFDPAAVSHGHGLASLRQRAEVLGGHIEVASVRGQGTTVTLMAPVGGSKLKVEG